MTLDVAMVKRLLTEDQLLKWHLLSEQQQCNIISAFNRWLTVNVESAQSECIFQEWAVINTFYDKQKVWICCQQTFSHTIGGSVNCMTSLENWYYHASTLEHEHTLTYKFYSYTCSIGKYMCTIKIYWNIHNGNNVNKHLIKMDEYIMIY